MIEQLTSSTWWRGALKSAAVNLAAGVAIGLVSAAAIYWLVPSTLLGYSMAGVVSFVTAGEAFSPLPLMAFNGIISSAVGLFTGGSAAVAAERQRTATERTENKLMDLDGRTQTLEQTVSPSRATQKILAQGPRNAGNFRDAEDARAAAASSTPTIH